jgi:hypothetical protein
MKFSRRSILRGATGGALALPLLESFSASAQATNVPKRLFIITTGQGTLLNRWKPPTLAGDALQMTELLQPLQPYQSSLNVISGVRNAVRAYHVSNGHNAAGRTLMTAHLVENSADAQGNLRPANQRTQVEGSSRCIGPSFDQELARRLNVGLPLSMAVLQSNPGENRMWYRVRPAGQTGANPEVPLATDPVALFRSFVGTGPAPVTTRADRLKGQRTPVLDSVRQSLNQLKTKVSAADRQRLDAHADRLAALETRLAAAPVMGCSGRTQMLPAGYPTSGQPNEHLAATALLDVGVQALACNANRIVTMQFTDYHSPTFEWLPTGRVDGWHAQIHGDTGGTPNDNRQLIAGFTWYATRVAYLLQQMSQVMEPNGKSLLDNSVVLWMSEFGNGARHSTDDLPVVLAGSLQGAIRTNRHLNRTGKHTGDLFHGLFQAFGVSPTGFGYQGEASLVPTGLNLG